MLLQHIKDQWNREIAGKEKTYKLQELNLVITVPASFDEVASKLTLQAAKEAGFDQNKIQFLEEPHAAFLHYANNYFLGEQNKSDIAFTRLIEASKTREQKTSCMRCWGRYL